MQGDRSAIGSLPETLDFEHGSTSSSPTIDPQICWSHMRRPADHRLSDYLPPPSHTGTSYLNAVGHEGQNLSRWSLGESSSSIIQNEVSFNEPKPEHEWSALGNACVGIGPRLRERQYEPTSGSFQDSDDINLGSSQITSGPLYMRRSSTEVSPPNLNLNARFIGNAGDDCQVMEYPHSCKPSSSVSEWITSASSSSEPFSTSGSGGYLVEENDGRPGCPSEVRRLSCKRKAIEGSIGQSSASGGSRSFPRTENSAWHAVTSRGSSLDISSTPENGIGSDHSEQLNSRLGLNPRGVASESRSDLSMAGVVETSHRNFRSALNTPLQVSIPQNFVSTGNEFRHSNNLMPRQSTLLPPSLSLPPVAAEASSFQSPPVAVQVPAVRRSAHSTRWSRGSNSRSASSSSLFIPGERGAPQPEEASFRNSRHILEHPMFVPATELRNMAQNPTNRSSVVGSVRIPRTVASASRSSSNSAIAPSSAPNAVPSRNPSSRYPRRLTEYVRRSLLSSVGSESGSSGINYSATPAGPASQEVALSSGTTNQGNHPTYPRSAMWLERQGDGVFGVPYSVRTFASASEGRSRLVSEIRNVLDLMRRGEGLRFEDVMLLDQSVLFGVADIHDRHRDMRLDVDNMSYEELLALEERIGNVNTGLSEETIAIRLKQHKYLSIKLEDNPEAEPCCVCQEEYHDGEDLGTLECGHEFHSGCIKQWLMVKNLCPICKTTALST